MLADRQTATKNAGLTQCKKIKKIAFCILPRFSSEPLIYESPENRPSCYLNFPPSPFR